MWQNKDVYYMHTILLTLQFGMRFVSWMTWLWVLTARFHLTWCDHILLVLVMVISAVLGTPKLEPLARS